MATRMEKARPVWVGVDWGTRTHAVRAVAADDGATRLSFTAAHTPEGLAALVARLQALGAVQGVAVETRQHLVVTALVEAGLAVYPINPKVSHAWRKGWAVSEAKDDGRDAAVLARGLREHHARYAPWKPGDAATRELAHLCEDEQVLIGQRTALVQQLRAALARYHPEALTWFADWTRPTAWDFVVAFPTPARLAEATTQQLAGFLKSHRIGLRPRWQERIAQRARALSWPQDPPTIAAKSVLAVALAKQLRALEAQLQGYRARIAAAYGAHPAQARYASVPGAGPKLGPRLLALVEGGAQTVDSAAALQQVTGTVPVTFQSGTRKQVRMRRACRKSARHVLHLFAWQAALHGGWSQAFFQQACAKGQKPALALRNLAAKWLKILHAMRQSGKPYSEAYYQEQLRKHGSPLAAALRARPRWITSPKKA